MLGRFARICWRKHIIEKVTGALHIIAILKYRAGAPAQVDEKLEYVHRHPVEALAVKNSEEYFFSSARNYSGTKGYIGVFFCMP